MVCKTLMWALAVCLSKLQAVCTATLAPHGWDTCRWAAGRSWYCPRRTATPTAGCKLTCRAEEIEIQLASLKEKPGIKAASRHPHTFAHDAGELARQVALRDGTGARLRLPAGVQVGTWSRTRPVWAQQGALRGDFLSPDKGLDGRHDHLVELLQGPTQIAALQHILVAKMDLKQIKELN